MKRWIMAGATALLALATAGGVAWAVLMLVEPRSTETHGETTITWDSSFEDLDYTVGDTIDMTVNWTVDQGSAKFVGFDLRGPKFTPKGPDPAKGELTSVVDGTGGAVLSAGQTGSVDVQFLFTELHRDSDRNVEIGNAHFSLFLKVDTDGDGAVDKRVKLGVNVHVEDPQ